MTTVRVACRCKTPFHKEHADHDDHCDTSQSIGHGWLLHTRLSLVAPHDAPGSVVVRERVDRPLPHGLEHSDHAVHVVCVQLRAINNNIGFLKRTLTNRLFLHMPGNPMYSTHKNRHIVCLSIFVYYACEFLQSKKIDKQQQTSSIPAPHNCEQPDHIVHSPTTQSIGGEPHEDSSLRAGHGAPSHDGDVRTGRVRMRLPPSQL